MFIFISVFTLFICGKNNSGTIATETQKHGVLYRLYPIRQVILSGVEGSICASVANIIHNDKNITE